MKSFFKMAVYCFLLFAFSSVVGAVGASLELTNEEREWIKMHPQITVANEADWPPFDYIENGKPAGYSIDVVRLIEKKTGLKVKFVNGFTWQELMQQFKAGKIDLLPALFINKKRQDYILFTKSYYAQPSVMVVHKDNTDIVNIRALAGKRVAGVKGFSFTSTIEKVIPDVTMVLVDNILEGLKAVSLNKADAFIDSIGAISYTLENNYIPNVKTISKVDNSALVNPSIHMGLAKEKPIFGSIMDKALASITRAEKHKLATRWFSAARTSRNKIKNNFLTSEQETWLSKHSTIRVGVMNAWPPMDYVDINDNPRGIGVEFIQAINKRLGNRLEIVSGPWEDIYNAVQEKRLDALMDITPRDDRNVLFNFTLPYISVPHNIFTRKGELPKSTLSDLSSMVVGVEKRFFIAEELQKNYPQILLKEYGSTSDALDGLSKGETDAYIGNRAVASYIIENELITNIVVQGKITETASINAIGVRKDWPILRDILQKSLNDISVAERSKIINPNPQQNRLEGIDLKLFQKLTKEERTWLNKKPIIHLGIDSGWAPVEWIDGNGNYQGMTSDYIKIIADMLDLQVEKPEKQLWPEILDGVKNKKLDLLPAVVSTEERREFINFTTPYLNFPFVIFTRDDAPLVTDLRDIYGKRVGIEKGYLSQKDLQRDHPQLELVEFKTTKEILHALSVGKIDAYVGNLTVAVYLLNREGLTNIKVAAPTTYDFDLSIGIRKDWPEFHSIIEKSLSLINEVQRNEIRQRWLKLNFEIGVDYSLVIRAVIIVVIILIIVLLWGLFIQQQKQKLKVAKEETDKANEAYLLANQKLMHANIKLKEMDRMKSMFVASISHELRTPLNSIIGFSSMMTRGSFGELNEKYQDYSTRIHNSGKHLLSLITDIIDISKIEAGRVDVILEDFDLKEIVSEVVETLGQQIAQKNLSLDVIIQDPMIMHTDKRRLYQSLLNLLSNAMKYTEKGGIILRVEQQGEQALLKVSDTGVGISKVDQSRLFEAFERMESHLKVIAGGTGLGLYLTKKIVTDLLQGDVGMESKVDEGSTFWIRVPIHIDT